MSATNVEILEGDARVGAFAWSAPTSPRAFPVPDAPVIDLPGWVARHPIRERPVGRVEPLRRVLDVVVASLLSVVTLPVVAVAAALVKASDVRAPAFYRQERTGLGGERFSIFKLRSMVRDADELRASLAHLNSRTGPDFKIAHDPRVTRIGRVLRATSIDELPQLWAVVAGRMSLVGPRPTSMPVDQYADWHRARLTVPAGVTGLWQLIGRDLPSFDDRVHIDLAYIQRRCLRLDVEILCRTVPALLRVRGLR